MRQRCLIGMVIFALCGGIRVAHAQYYELPPGAGPYVRADIGPSFFEDGTLTGFGGPANNRVQYQGGFTSDVAIGYAFNEYLAADFQVGFIGANIDSVQGFASDNSTLSAVPFLANVILSLPIPHSLVTPYIGVGAGGAGMIFDTDSFGAGGNTVFGRESDVVFAWQAMAGLRFKLNSRMTLGLGYKYFATGDPTFSYPPDSFNVGFEGVRTHSVLFTFQMNFW